ncbi:MAG TPA: IS21 family transposase [Planctomycetota bacterium]|nr:IS21 family transposase [Planctomycetota bacterium]
MAIKALKERGSTARSIAKVLGVTEGSIRYHLRRQAAGAVDGRAGQVHLAAKYDEAILTWLEGRGPDAPMNLVALHQWLAEEHGYEGSARSIQRYFRVRFPRPARRARRRVETPPGAQGQVDWAEFRGVSFVDGPRDLYALHVTLSFSRYDVVVWSERKDLLSWLWCHGEALRRLEGVPATLRVDNEKTAVSRGAGAWGEVHPAYRRFAEIARFHVDACAPRSPEAKGKVERRIRDQRLSADPRSRVWTDMPELQTWTDEEMLRSAKRRRCSATGTSVFEAWCGELEHLGELPVLPEPFDLVATRRVADDCTVAFEGRRYSVPFRLVGQTVEVRGCAGRVQVVAEAAIVAQHERHTERLLVLDPAHFEGEATELVLPPLPLGRMGKRLQEIAALVPEQRPLDLYAELAEVAR